MTSTSEPSDPAEPVAAADPVLLAAREFAREALGQITDPHSIGSDDGHEVHEAHVLTLYFECRLSGYPGWRWAATLARVDENSPVTLLETELLPGDGAVVAPEWVPWSERLAQYRDAQAKQADEEAAVKAAAQAGVSDDDDSDDDDAEDDIDDDDNDAENDVDEDGFADIDEHDLHDDDEDDLDGVDDLGEETDAGDDTDGDGSGADDDGTDDK